MRKRRSEEKWHVFFMEGGAQDPEEANHLRWFLLTLILLALLGVLVMLFPLPG